MAKFVCKYICVEFPIFVQVLAYISLKNSLFVYVSERKRETHFTVMTCLIALKRSFVAIILVLSVFFNAIFHRADFSSDPFDF